MDEPVVRVATMADAEACNAFHNAHHGEARTLAQWTWAFGRSPDARQELPFVLAELSGRVVGTQAFMEVPFLDSRGRYLTAKSEETLVAPEMRGRDLLRAMYARLFDVARQRSVRCIWGFTPAEVAFRRIGFDVPTRTGQLFHPISASAGLTLAGDEASGARLLALRAGGIGAAGLSALVRAVRGTRRPRHDGSAIVVQPLREPADGIGRLCETFVQQWGGTTICRDRPFLDWRIATNPYVRANCFTAIWRDELVGYCAVALGPDGVGYLVDVLAADVHGDPVLASRVVGALLDHSVRRLRDMGATAVRAWRVGGHPFNAVVTRAAHAAGFASIDRGHAVVVHSAFADAPEPVTFDDWYVTRLYTEGRSG